MRRPPFRPLLTVALGAGLALSLSGCGELRAGRALEGVPEIADADVPIRRALDADTVYPNLADVPLRPPDLPTAAVLRARLEALRADRDRAAVDRDVILARGEGLATPPTPGPDRIGEGYRPPPVPSLAALRPPDPPRLAPIPEATDLIPVSPVASRESRPTRPRQTQASRKPAPSKTAAAPRKPAVTPTPAPRSVAATPAAPSPSVAAPPSSSPPATATVAPSPTVASAPPPAAPTTAATAPTPVAPAAPVDAPPPPAPPTTIADALRTGAPLPPPRAGGEEARPGESGVRLGPPAFRSPTPGPEEAPPLARLLTGPPVFDPVPALRPPPPGRPSVLAYSETVPPRAGPSGPLTGPRSMAEFRPPAGDGVTEQVAILTFGTDEADPTEGDRPLLARVAAAQSRLAGAVRVLAVTPRDPRPPDVSRARAQAQSVATALIRLGASPAQIFVGIAEGGTSRSGDRAEIYLDY